MNTMYLDLGINLPKYLPLPYIPWPLVQTYADACIPKSHSTIHSTICEVEKREHVPIQARAIKANETRQKDSLGDGLGTKQLL